jgi:hypothetical protein
MKLYRYTTNGEGVWSAGKRLLPKELIDEANKSRTWLAKPNLPEGNYQFWLKESGNEKYLNTLYKTHQKYLPNITCHDKEVGDDSKIIFEDEYQVVEEL